jgi:Tfp pilus assembly protein PilF
MVTRQPEPGVGGAAIRFALVTTARRRRAARQPPPDPPPPPRPDVPPALLAVALFALAVILYWPVRGHEFLTYDDYSYVKDNPRVAAGLTAANVAWAFTTLAQANWHPLTWLSHMLDVQLYGQAPGAHHFTSVLLHGLNAALVLFVLHLASGRLAPSTLVAVLFAVHPLNVESVAWIAQRKTLLSTTLGLLALAAYVSHARRPSRWRYALVAGLLTLSLLAKPMLVTFPLLLLLLDRFALGRWAPLEKVPLLLICAASGVVTVVAQRAGGAVASLAAIPFHVRVGNALVACVAYLGQALWPSGLAVFYPHPQQGLSAAVVVGSALLLAAISFAVWRAHARHPLVALGWLWYLVTLLPVIGIVQVGGQARADRYVYLPLLGIFVMAAWALDAVAARDGRAADAVGYGAAAVLGVALAVPARAQIHRWKDTATLFSHTRAATGPNAVAEFNLGLVDVEARRWPQAIERFRESVRLDPGYADAHANLGAAYAEAGDLPRAVAHLERAARLAPGAARIQANLGTVLARSRRHAEAAERFRLALAADPTAVDARLGLGFALLEVGPRDEAERAFAEAIARRPGSEASLRSRVCATLSWKNELEAASAQCAQALRLDPRRADAHDTLGSILLRQGDLAGAIQHSRSAVAAEPGNAAFLDRLGLALVKAQQPAEAAAVLREAVARQPGSADTHANLGVALLMKGDWADGIAQLEEALRLDPQHQVARQNLAAARAARR